MKGKLIISAFLISYFLSNSISNAQNYYSVLSWNASIPTGELDEFISQPSYRGFGLEFGVGINEHVSLGLSVSWNVFYEALDYGSYTEGNLTLTGKQYRYFNAFPMMITVKYSLYPGSIINPYIAGGIGVYNANKKAQIGLYEKVYNTWQPGLFPEAGANFYLTDDFGIKLAARYNYALSTSTTPAISYFSLVLGFAFLY